MAAATTIVMPSHLSSASLLETSLLFSPSYETRLELCCSSSPPSEINKSTTHNNTMVCESVENVDDQSMQPNEPFEQNQHIFSTVASSNNSNHNNTVIMIPDSLYGKVIGLTGSIAVGKSYFCDKLSHNADAQNFPCITLKEEAHKGSYKDVSNLSVCKTHERVQHHYNNCHQQTTNDPNHLNGNNTNTIDNNIHITNNSDTFINKTALEFFIEDVKRHAGIFQVYMYSDALNRTKIGRKMADSVLKPLVVLDRTPWDNACFFNVHKAEQNIDNIGSDFYNIIRQQWNPQDIDTYLFFDVSPTHSIEHVRMRGDPGESNYTIEYFDMLDTKFFSMICMNFYTKRCSHDFIPIMVLSWHNFGNIQTVMDNLDKVYKGELTLPFIEFEIKQQLTTGVNLKTVTTTTTITPPTTAMKEIGTNKASAFTKVVPKSLVSTQYKISIIGSYFADDNSDLIKQVTQEDLIKAKNNPQYRVVLNLTETSIKLSDFNLRRTVLFYLARFVSVKLILLSEDELNY